MLDMCDLRSSCVDGISRMSLALSRESLTYQFLNYIELSASLEVNLSPRTVHLGLKHLIHRQEALGDDRSHST